MSEYLKRVQNILVDHDQQVVSNEDKSRVILAGPGSGKTYLLTTKVAKLLFEQKVFHPHKIVCLTYSRLLEKQLRYDLERLGIIDDERLFVATVHAFCISEVIIPFANLYHLNIPMPLRICSEPEMIEALDIALHNQDLSLPNDNWSKKNLLRDLHKYRKLFFDNNNGVFPEARPDSPDLNWLQLTNDYAQVLRQGNICPPSIDFVEIELIALHTIQQHELVQKFLAAKFHWWIIDEYQDLGKPFHSMILCLIEKTDIKIMAIGDPNQCIFEEVQGSKPEYIVELAHRLISRDKTTTIELKTNYRCSQEIIDLSTRILGQNIAYQSGLQRPGQCNVIRTTYRNQMLQRLLNHLAHTEGINLDQIAILNPTRRNLNSIADMLTRSGWPNYLDKDPEYERRELTEWIEELANWCVSGIRRPYLNDLLPFWVELNRLFYADVQITNDYLFELHLFKVLSTLQIKNMNLGEWFNQLLEGLKLEPMIERYGEIQPDDVLEFERLKYAILEGRRLSQLSLEQFSKVGQRIQLTTLHSSKGCQFEAVIITDFDGIPRQQNIRPSFLDRRLMYVAVTRAKSRIYLLHSTSSAFFVSQIAEQPLSKGLQFFRFDGSKVYKVNNELI